MGRLCCRRCRGPLASEHQRDLPKKIAWPEPTHFLTADFDRDFSVRNDEELVPGGALFGQHRPGCHFALLGDRCDRVQISSGQPAEQRHAREGRDGGIGHQGSIIGTDPACPSSRSEARGAGNHNKPDADKLERGQLLAANDQPGYSRDRRFQGQEQPECRSGQVLEGNHLERERNDGRKKSSGGDCDQHIGCPHA